MKEYIKFIAKWVVPNPGNIEGFRTVKAEVSAISREHAVSKLLCDTKYQISLMIAFGKEIENCTFNHQFLIWLPISKEK